MSEQHFAYKVRQNLNLGLHDISPEVLDRLASGRGAALARQKRVATKLTMASAGGLGQFDFGGITHYRGAKQLLLAIALGTGVVLSTLWVADRQVEELGNIDSALLSGDLPIGVFTDKGFDAWLKSSSSQPF